jgi:hypothetical protein
MKLEEYVKCKNSMTAEYEIIKKLYILPHVIKNILGQEEGDIVVDNINSIVERTSVDILEIVNVYCQQREDLHPIIEFLENDNWRCAIGLSKELIDSAEKYALDSMRQELEILI